jgi:hypothetical protein
MDVSRPVLADTRRLTDVSSDMGLHNGQARDPVSRYRAAVAALNDAPLDLGAPLTDLSPGVAERIHRLDELGRVPREFATRMRALEHGPASAGSLGRHLLVQRPEGARGDEAPVGADPLGWLRDQPWFTVPWAISSATDALRWAGRTLVLAAGLRRAAALYETEVASFAHAPPAVRQRQWWRWQQEVSRTVGLDRAMAAVPELAAHRAALHAGGRLEPGGWRLPPWARTSGKAFGRVTGPVSGVLDLHTLTAPDASRLDRGFAVAGLGSLAITAGAAVGVVASPVIVGAGVVAGVAATGYGLYTLWDEYGDAVAAWARRSWDWATDTARRAREGATHAVSRAADRALDRAQHVTEGIGSVGELAGRRAARAADAIGSALSDVRGAATGTWRTAAEAVGS